MPEKEKLDLSQMTPEQKELFAAFRGLAQASPNKKSASFMRLMGTLKKMKKGG
jgi:hypothetical protein